MVDVQTKEVNGQQSTSPVRGFVGQAAEVTGDAIELAELQVQLVKADAADAMRDAIRPAMSLTFGAVLLLASLPILLLAIAGFMTRYLGLNAELSQLIVALAAAFVAILVIVIAVRRFQSSLAPFGRSAEELKHNLAWLKTIFRSTNP